MRCPRCGNDNPGTNRFCGMCGATLLQAPAAVAAGPAQGTAAADSGKSPAAPPAVRQETGTRPAPSNGSPSNNASSNVSSQDSASSNRAASNDDDTPVISGPSFLGLNQRSPHPAYSSGRRHSSLSIDPHSSSGSRNLDYLLEDDESSGGGALKFVLIFVALVLAIGLGYLRWKNEGLAWLTAVTKKPSAATQPADSTDTNASTPNNSNAPNTAPAGTPPVQPAPSQPTSGSPSAAAPTATPSSAAPPSTAPPSAATSSASPSAASPPSAGSTSAAPGASQPSTAPATANPENASAPAATSPPAAGETSNSGSDANSAAAQPSGKKEPSDDESEAPAKPEKHKPSPAPAKPSAASKPAIASDSVAEAQRYLYGKGAAQDCERGLRILKPAAQASNPKAMVEMGALYSAGLCTPRDLPTAYRWFAMALRKDPDNQAIQTDLQKLWGEMTQPERQLAIRLTQ